MDAARTVRTPLLIAHTHACTFVLLPFAGATLKREESQRSKTTSASGGRARGLAGNALLSMKHNTANGILGHISFQVRLGFALHGLA